MEENYDMRNMLLGELIDKMHGRLADKMFPPDPSHADIPAVEGVKGPQHEAMGQDIPNTDAPAAVNDEEGATPDASYEGSDRIGIPDEDEMSEEELEEMLSHVNKP